MARRYAHRKGKSHSTRPTSKRAPTWVTYSPDEIAMAIVRMVKEGLTLSEIGVRLRDQYNVPSVRPILGKSISRVLEENGLKPAMPEDLDRLLKRAKRLKAHLEVHKADRKNIHSLELLESKIHRLSTYYKGIGLLPEGWRYKAAVAQLA